MRLVPAILAAALLALPLGVVAQPPAAMAPAAQPTAEQRDWGRRMAEAGDFNAIVGAMGDAEVDRMAREAPGLTDAERERLRVLGAAELAVGRAHILDQVAFVYARHFTLDQLREITTFLESPTGRAYTGAIPTMLPDIAAVLQGNAFGVAVRRSFCRETHKLCEGH